MATSFYEETLRRLIRLQHLDPERDRILVVAGGPHDRDVFQSCGFRHVTISNLDVRLTGDEFAPYDWKFYNAECIEAADGSYDVVVIHSGLHHCFVPQKAIAEMLRVARRGTLLFEPYDNLLTRVGTALGVGQDYETAAVYYNDCAFGGVANTPIANFVYRFTQREIIKTVACALPHGPASHLFFHKLLLPWGQLKGRRNKLVLPAVLLAFPFLKLFGWIFPRQTNCFAAWVGKPNAERGWWPWIEEKADGTLTANTRWLETIYRK